jgi:acetyltransferase
LNRIQDRSIGISYFVSTGNEAVLESSDFIECLLDDSHTKVIMALIEGIRDAEKFLRVADLALKRKKPILVMKIGKTESGGKAASSHTGSMTGADSVMMRLQTEGIIRVETWRISIFHTQIANAARRRQAGRHHPTTGGRIILTDKLVEIE